MPGSIKAEDSSKLTSLDKSILSFRSSFHILKAKIQVKITTGLSGQFALILAAAGMATQCCNPFVRHPITDDIWTIIRNPLAFVH